MTTFPSVPTALIAEDEPLLAAHLRRELGRLWPELQVVAQVGDGESALRQALTLRPQVCFLDIRMPGLSGLEAAEALAEDWPDDVAAFPLLVFVTAYDQYAVQAFERQAVDYLLKPVAAPRLADCVLRLKTRLALGAPSAQASPAAAAAAAPASGAEELARAVEQLRALAASLALPGSATPSAPPRRLEVIQAQVGHTVHLVPIDEVIYFEAADKYVRVVTAEREHLIRTAMRELLPQLDAQRFWQVHRGTVVQVRWIERAVRDEAGRISLSLRGRPQALSVSRLYAHLFKGM
jgi:DNA-binding LytR/AlgR family response regulator